MAPVAASNLSAGVVDITREEIELFLIDEAALLDDWRLEEWRALFLPDCLYLVPNLSVDPYTPHDSDLYLIADDGHHLTERVKRLSKRTAHAEYPHSHTHRMISNVRLLGGDQHDLRVQSRFITIRESQGANDTYFGRHEYRLVLIDDRWMIREKRTILGMVSLRPQGRLSIIV